MSEMVKLEAPEDQGEFRRWAFRTTLELERSQNDVERARKEIAREKKRLAEAKKSFERDMADFKVSRIYEREAQAREKRLFEMQLKMLREELKKLAGEKVEVKNQKAYYDKIIKTQTSDLHEKAVVRGDLFFCGVTDAPSLKKRYKDLMKIYHPDNANGDNDTLLEITKEYNKLKEKLG